VITRDNNDYPALIAAHHAGDREASARLGRTVLETCSRAVRAFRLNDTDTADALGLALLLVFEKLHTFNGTAHFRTWVHVVAANATRMMLRINTNRKKLGALVVGDAEPFDTVEGHIPPPDALVEEREVVVAVRRAVADLPDRGTISAIARHFDDGEHFDTIARDLGVVEGSLRSRLFRARRTLGADPGLRAALGMDDEDS